MTTQTTSVPQRTPADRLVSRGWCLTPEEDSLPDPDDDEIDDSLPADLWFRDARRDRGYGCGEVNSG